MQKQAEEVIWNGRMVKSECAHECSTATDQKKRNFSWSTASEQMPKRVFERVHRKLGQ
jgi:hypothetical protein